MSVVDSAAHRTLAKQAAVEGIVLLKNDDSLLPLGGGRARLSAAASSREAASQAASEARGGRPQCQPHRVARVQLCGLQG